MIYFIQDAGTYHIKIGYTGGDPEGRLKALQTGNPSGLVLLLTIPGSEQDEQNLHDRFGKYHVRGEWFLPAPELIQFMAKCGQDSSIEVSYKDYLFRSRLEARWAVYFDTIGLKWEYEAEAFEMKDHQTGETVNFLPDFWLPEVKSWAEVKQEALNLDEIRKVDLLVWHTKKRCILLVGTPKIKSYSYVTLPYFNNSEKYLLSDILTIEDECGDVISMFHGYPHSEHRFFGSPGWGGEISEEQAISESFEDVVEAVHASRSARFDNGKSSRLNHL